MAKRPERPAIDASPLPAVRVAPEPAAAPEMDVEAEADIAEADPKAPKWRRNASRVGRIQVSCFLNPEAKLQLDLLSVYEGKHIQRLVLEGIDLMFQSYGKSRCAVEAVRTGHKVGSQ